MNLGGLARTLRALAAVPADTARDACVKINELIQDGFDAGQDPYAQAWEGLAARTLRKGRTNPPLDDSGAMRGGTVATPSAGAGIELASPSPSNFHQSGTRYMSRRRVLPDSGLPASWREAIAVAARAAMARRMGRS